MALLAQLKSEEQKVDDLFNRLSAMKTERDRLHFENRDDLQPALALSDSPYFWSPYKHPPPKTHRKAGPL